MSSDYKSKKLDITVELATKLIVEQFPQWAHLQIKSVALSGTDNITFRLGSEMSMRLPSAEGYAEQVKKEQKWLPLLAAHLSFSIPEPIAMGYPSKNYPWNWSVYRWIDGESANALAFDESDLEHIAVNLAQFLNELHKIDVAFGPLPGFHNYWRGDTPAVYDVQARAQIVELKDIIDVKTALSLLEKAIASKWHHEPVWIHGDFASGNILIKNGNLKAVIDFGCMGIGDPACDLVIAWTFLKNKAREIFKDQVNLDSDTWARARGWALWKATFELCALTDKSGTEGLRHRYIIQEVLNEYNNETL